MDKNERKAPRKIYDMPGFANMIDEWLRANKPCVTSLALRMLDVGSVCSKIPEHTVKMWKIAGNHILNEAALKVQSRDYMRELVERMVTMATYPNTVELGAAIGTRSFEPRKRIFKACEGGIIVVATIPKDAYVIGNPGGKCRADKADIVDIIGDLGGKKIGVSMYDPTTCYNIGDKIQIDNFDFSDEECSTGFHFFCTPVEARRYYDTMMTTSPRRYRDYRADKDEPMDDDKKIPGIYLLEEDEDESTSERRN